MAEYHGEKIFLVPAIGKMTRNWKMRHTQFEFEEMNDELTGFMTKLLESSKGLFDAMIDTRIYNEEDWHFIVSGWIETDDEDKALYDAFIADQAAKKVEIETNNRRYERSVLTKIAQKYGIELPELPDVEDFVVMDETVKTGLSSGNMPPWYNDLPEVEVNVTVGYTSNEETTTDVPQTGEAMVQDAINLVQDAIEEATTQYFIEETLNH